MSHGSRRTFPVGQGVNGVPRSRAVWHPKMHEGTSETARKLGVCDVEGDCYHIIVISTLRTQEKSHFILTCWKICVQLCSWYIYNTWTQGISQPLSLFALTTRRLLSQIQFISRHCVRLYGFSLYIKSIPGYFSCCHGFLVYFLLTGSAYLEATTIPLECRRGLHNVYLLMIYNTH